MHTVTVSEKGQVVIPAEIRRRLGITPGCQLDFILEDNTLRVEVKRRIQPSRPEDGYGMLVCKKPGQDDYPTSTSLKPCARRLMIALDTNILARFYVDDPNDSEAASSARSRGASSAKRRIYSCR